MRDSFSPSNGLLDQEAIRHFRQACIGAVAKFDHTSGLYLPLWIHSIDTMIVIDWLYSHWLPGSIKKRWLDQNPDPTFWNSVCLLLGLIHDLGKILPDFQSIVPEDALAAGFYQLRNARRPHSKKKILRHDASGAAMIHRISARSSLMRSLASVIGAHHGEFQTGVGKMISRYSAAFYGVRTPETPSREEIEEIWRVFLHRAQDVAGYREEFDTFPISGEDLMILSGLVVMADWLSSNTHYFPLLEQNEEMFGEYDPDRLKNGLEKIQLPPPWKSSFGLSDSFDFASLFGNPPYPMQSAVMEAAAQMEHGGLLLIEAEMGSGKTEAGLAAANIFSCKQEAGGLFFGLPTQATANGLFSRIEKWGEHEAQDTTISIRLAHGRAFQNPDFQQLVAEADHPAVNGLIASDWLLGRKRELLADFVVGTIDQALLCAVSSRHVMLYHAGMAGKVVILDEVHNYDTFTNENIDRLLSWLGAYEVPVILLSATLPVYRRIQMLDAYLSGQAGISPPSMRGDDLFHAEKWKDQSRFHFPDQVLMDSYPLLTWTIKDEVFCKKTEPSRHQEVQLCVINRDERRSSGKKDGQTKQNEEQSQEFSRSLTAFDIEPFLNPIQDVLERSLKEGGTAVVIANTVRDAQKMYLKMRDTLHHTEVLLFHSRFTDTDRSKAERKVLAVLNRQRGPAGGKRTVVIASPIVEQSLDIDADLLITQLCPGDLFLQRLGRLHRSSTICRPPLVRQAVCYVYGMEPEHIRSGYYSSWLMERTRRFLLERSRIQLPEDIPVLMEQTFGISGKDRWDPILNTLYKEHLDCELHRKEKAFDQLIAYPEKLRSSFGKDYGIDADSSYFPTLNGCSNPRVLLHSRGVFRYGLELIEVLLVKEADDGLYSPFSSPECRIRGDQPITEDEYQLLIKERISLPVFFSLTGVYESTTAALAVAAEERFSGWKEQLSYDVLLLDHHNQAVLSHRRLRYSHEYGLMLEQESLEQESVLSA